MNCSAASDKGKGDFNGAILIGCACERKSQLTLFAFLRFAAPNRTSSYLAAQRNQLFCFRRCDFFAFVALAFVKSEKWTMKSYRACWRSVFQKYEERPHGPERKSLAGLLSFLTSFAPA